MSIKKKKVIVVMPAYNAEKTLLHTHKEVLEQECVDLIVIVDDASSDGTVELAKSLHKTLVFSLEKNKGYGANQKKCYQMALDQGADIVVMVHPDYQYTPKLIPAMASLIANDVYDCVIGSRILGGGALAGGMPVWKYVCNRVLTFLQNMATGAKLSEYHTGYRAFSRRLLETLPVDENSDDFVFDNQIMLEMIGLGVTIAEISCPTKYFPEASSINLTRSVKYGLGCVLTTLEFLARRSKRFGEFDKRRAIEFH